MDIKQLSERATKLETDLKRFINDFEKLSDNTDRTVLNENDLYAFDMLYQMADKSEGFISLSKQMNKPVLSVGRLSKNHNDRYELNGYEFSSGSPIEIWILDDYYNSGGYWESTSIEHTGNDYYAVGFRDEPLTGLMARIK